MDLQTSILDCFEKTSEPLLANEILRSLQSVTSTKLKPKSVTEALATLAAVGRITMVKGLRKGSSQAAYTTHNPLDLASEALVQVVGTLPTAVAMTKLKGLLVKPLRPWFDEALGRLIVQGQAYYLPRGKSRLVQNHPPKPSEILPASAMLQMKKILEQSNRLRKSPLTLSDLLSWLDQNTDEPIHVVPRPHVKSSSLSANQLIAWQKADARSGSSSMVAIPATFARYRAWAAEMGEQVDVELFKRVLKGLYDTGHAILEPHERPHELQAEDRELQVSMALGPPGYYWGLLE